MTKNIHTLVKDIEDVVKGEGGWDEVISKACADGLKEALDKRLKTPREEYKPYLRLSQVGQPCKRKLWYSLNRPEYQEELTASSYLKFLYGDLLEELLLSLAKAAGHRVEGEQDELRVGGIKGHRDCVIDGITVDVKTASTYSFKKFQSGALRDNDPFGYISQLSSYVYAGKDSEVESHPTLGAFLVIDKTLGNLCLDLYDFGPEIDQKEQEVEEVKELVSQPEPPERGFEDEPDGKSGNRKLGVACSYCGFKDKCWPNLRKYLYSSGPRYLTHVEQEPRVPEVK